MTLGYSCDHCKSAKLDGCRVNGQLVEKRPNPRQGELRWFRHACDTCRNLTPSKNQPGCSWLQDRFSWDRACQRCSANQLTCLGSSYVVEHPTVLKVPTVWSVTHKLDGGWSELRGCTPWRKSCVTCQAAKSHCRALGTSALFSCNRCLQLGIDCRVEQGDGTVTSVYPQFDLSRVGFGNFLPFKACSKCIAHGRNCDRQRPCDSCVDNGDECDDYSDKTAGNTNCLPGRLPGWPGCLYYLGLGYGPNGVNDVKDGSRMCHWIGPAIPLYSMVGVREATETHDDNAKGILAVAEALGKAARPTGVPPHGGPGGDLALRPPSSFTAEELDAMILRNWVGRPTVPNLHPSYYDAIEEAENVRARLRGGARLGQPRPNRNRSRGQSQATAAGSATRSQDSGRVIEIEDDIESDDDGDDDDDDDDDGAGGEDDGDGDANVLDMVEEEDIYDATPPPEPRANARGVVEAEYGQPVERMYGVGPAFQVHEPMRPILNPPSLYMGPFQQAHDGSTLGYYPLDTGIGTGLDTGLDAVLNAALNPGLDPAQGQLPGVSTWPTAWGAYEQFGGLPHGIFDAQNTMTIDPAIGYGAGNNAALGVHPSGMIPPAVEQAVSRELPTTDAFNPSEWFHSDTSLYARSSSEARKAKQTSSEDDASGEVLEAGELDTIVRQQQEARRRGNTNTGRRR
ncbi:hypothetical protein RJ55_06610 [Drechmeria coniospora]|nr:hypothetical protein RJ55_06610 [Drechmeria coniospora]